MIDFFFFFSLKRRNTIKKKKKEGIKDSGVGIKETRIKTENIDSNKMIYSLIYLRKRHKNYEKREKNQIKSNRKIQNNEKRK
jgi:hypothetical protein